MHSFINGIIFTPICSISVKKRMIIRYTWGIISKRMNYKVIFCSGARNKIYEEKYNDIIQFSFKDSYYNLTIATLLFYNWTKRVYNKFNYIIKIDSDVYPNLQLINLYILLYIKEKYIYGYLYAKMKTSRNANNTNYIPYHIYPSSIIPQFVAGSFYIFPKFNSYNRFIDYFNLSSTKLIYREDIQFGLYINNFPIKIMKINKYYNRTLIFKQCKDYSIHFAIHGVSIQNYFYIFNYC